MDYTKLINQVLEQVEYLDISFKSYGEIIEFHEYMIAHKFDKQIILIQLIDKILQQIIKSKGRNRNEYECLIVILRQSIIKN